MVARDQLSNLVAGTALAATKVAPCDRAFRHGLQFAVIFSSDTSFLKSNLHNAGGIMPKRVTSGGVHLPGLAPGHWTTQLRRKVAAAASRWRHCADLTCPGFEPQTSLNDSNVLKFFPVHVKCIALTKRLAVLTLAITK